MYEISVIVRDQDGNPVLDPVTGKIKRRYFKTDKPDKLATFWAQNSFTKKKRKRKSRAANKKETKAALVEIEQYIQKREKQKEKRVNLDDSH